MKFPKTLYVKIDSGGHGNEFFDPHQSVDTMVGPGETVKVGVYELTNIVKASGSVTVVPTTPVGERKPPARKRTTP